MRKNTQSISVFQQKNTPIRNLNVIQTNHIQTKSEKILQWLGYVFLFICLLLVVLVLAGIGMTMIQLEWMKFEWMKWYVPSELIKYQLISTVACMAGSWFFFRYSERRLLLRFNKRECWFNYQSEPIAWSDLDTTLLMKNRIGAQTTQSEQVQSFELKIGSKEHCLFIYECREIDFNTLKELVQFLPEGALSKPTANWNTPISEKNKWRAHSVANKSRRNAHIIGFVSFFLWVMANIIFMPDLINSGKLAFIPFLPKPNLAARSDEYMDFSMIMILIGGALGAWLIHWRLGFTRDNLSADKNGLYSKQHGLITWNSISHIRSLRHGKNNAGELEISFLNSDSVLVTHRWQVGPLSSVAKYEEICEAGCLEFGQLRPN